MPSQLVRARTICFVQDEKVRDLHQAGFHSLDGIARLRHKYDNRGIRGPGNIQFRLPDTNGLKEYDVLSRRIQDVRCLGCFSTEPSKTPA